MRIRLARYAVVNTSRFSRQLEDTGTSSTRTPYSVSSAPDAVAYCSTTTRIRPPSPGVSVNV
jgi:hypothetical protein